MKHSYRNILQIFLQRKVPKILDFYAFGKKHFEGVCVVLYLHLFLCDKVLRLTSLKTYNLHRK